MTFYSELTSIADDLIVEFGQSVTISRSVKTSDPIYGGLTDTVTTETFNVVNPPSSTSMRENFDNDAIEQAENIYKSIRFLVVSAHEKALVPRKNDKVTMGDTDYIIFGVTPVSPGGEDIVYRMAMGK